MALRADKADGFCDRSLAELADDLGIAKRAINRPLKELQDRELIERESGGFIVKAAGLELLRSWRPHERHSRKAKRACRVCEPQVRVNARILATGLRQRGRTALFVAAIRGEEAKAAWSWAKWTTMQMADFLGANRATIYRIEERLRADAQVWIEGPDEDLKEVAKCLPHDLPKRVARVHETQHFVHEMQQQACPDSEGEPVNKRISDLETAAARTMNHRTRELGSSSGTVQEHPQVNPSPPVDDPIPIESKPDQSGTRKPPPTIMTLAPVVAGPATVGQPTASTSRPRPVLVLTLRIEEFVKKHPELEHLHEKHLLDVIPGLVAAGVLDFDAFEVDFAKKSRVEVMRHRYELTVTPERRAAQ